MYEFDFHFHLKDLNGYRDLLDKMGKSLRPLKKNIYIYKPDMIYIYISGFSVKGIKQTQNQIIPHRQ